MVTLDVKNVHEKVLNSSNSRRFGHIPFISRMLKPLGQNQTFTVHGGPMMHSLFETCARVHDAKVKAHKQKMLQKHLQAPVIERPYDDHRGVGGEEVDPFVLRKTRIRPLAMYHIFPQVHVPMQVATCFARPCFFFF